MGRLDAVKAWLDANLADLAAEHEVPGVQVGVLADDTVMDSAAGVLSQGTGVEATTDAVFQVGSITKLWTSTLVMQLVDDGKLDLDDPVRRHLPEFRVADEAASARVTVRHLLTHTAGFEGDIFVPTTRDDDAVQRYVEDVLPTVAQSFEPGERFSYNNAGFVVLGRLVEVLRGTSYHAALREHLVEPLGLTRVATSAEEAILHRAAVGHLRARPDAPLAPTRTWSLAHSIAPAGAMLAMSARELLGFARMHLAGGLTADGTRLLSAGSAVAVREPQVSVPRRDTRPESWGLGWTLFDWDGGVVVGHNGGTIGQAACLRIVPDAGVAVAVLTNGGAVDPLVRRILGHVLGELTSVAVPDELVPPRRPEPVADPERYVGRYQVHSERWDVETDPDGGLLLATTPLGELADMLKAEDMLEAEPERFRFVRHSDDTFVGTERRDGAYTTVCFLGDDGSGRARFLHTGRALPRVA